MAEKSGCQMNDESGLATEENCDWNLDSSRRYSNCHFSTRFSDARMNVSSFTLDEVRPRAFTSSRDDYFCLNASSSWPPKFTSSNKNQPSCQLNFSNLYSRLEHLNLHTDMPEAVETFSPEVITEQTCCAGFSNSLDWERYKNFLYGIWEEHSLGNISLDDESSTLTSLSSVSEDIPYVLELLSSGEMVSKSNKSLHNNPSSDTNASTFQKSVSNETQHCDLPTKNMETNAFLSSGKGPGPHPFSNITKESSQLQGEANRRPTLPLRSKVPCEPSSEKKSHASSFYEMTSHANPYKTPECQSTNCAARHQSPYYALSSSYNEPFRRDTTLDQQPPCEVMKASLEETSFSNKHTSSNSWGWDHGPHQPNCTYNGHIKPSYRVQDEYLNARHLYNQVAPPASSHRIYEDENSFHSNSDCLREREMAYPVLPQGYKPSHHHTICPSSNNTCGYNGHRPLGRRASCQYPIATANRERIHGGYQGMESPQEIMNRLGMNDSRTLESLRDNIVALQIQNIELGLFLKKEELRRKEAEEAVKREKEYVRKLQNNLQDLGPPTLVMDPLMYKQVADKYIASRKKAVRRTHTCSPHFAPSDLVCDGNTLHVQKTQKHASCPSSPVSSKQENRSTALSVSPASPSRSTGTSSPSSPHYEGCKGRERNFASAPLSDSSEKHRWNAKKGDSSMKLEDYRELIQSLSGLEVSPSPP